MSGTGHLVLGAGAPDFDQKTGHLTLGGTTYELSCTTGSYAHVGNAVDLIELKILEGDSGTHSYTGNDAGLYRAMTAQSGSYQWTGNDVVFDVQRVVMPDDVTPVSDVRSQFDAASVQTFGTVEIGVLQGRSIRTMSTPLIQGAFSTPTISTLSVESPIVFDGPSTDAFAAG